MRTRIARGLAGIALVALTACQPALLNVGKGGTKAPKPAPRATAKATPAHAPKATPTVKPAPTASPTATRTVSPTLPPTQTVTPALGAFFTAGSAWWQPTRLNAAVDPQSATIAQALTAGGTYRILDNGAYGTSTYTADAQTPRYKVTITELGANKYGDNDLAHNMVPIPVGATPASGTDGKLVIIDPTTNKVYDLWQAKQVGGGWQAAWGGVYPLNGDGSSHNVTYGAGANQANWMTPTTRATGSGLSSLAGNVTLADIQAGSINHALAFSSDIACATSRWPATASDGHATGTCIPEGGHVQLDPSIDLAAIPGISPIELMIGRALQSYGAYCSDVGGARMAITAQVAHTSSEQAIYAKAGAVGDYYNFNKLPWSRLRVLTAANGQ
jgi:hypothetical protein